MGQQQLLLIVLGVIIVGIAIVVGINLFTANSVEANGSAVTSDNMNIAALAQQFILKPQSMGGGGISFAGFAIPANLATTANGTYTVTATAGSAVITGTGNVKNSGNKVYIITTTVNPTSVSTSSTMG